MSLAWACLALKEAGKKATDVRDREASRSYQEVALYLVIHVHIWCGVRRVGLGRVIVYYRLYGTLENSS